MAFPLALIPLILAAAGGTAQVIAGSSKAKKNKRPDYEIPDEYFDNQMLAEYYAQSGLSQEAKQALTQGAERGLSASIGTALQTGQGLNTIGDFYSNYLTGLGNIAVQDSAIQNQKIRDLYGVNESLGEMKTTEFLYDKDAPYKDKAQQAAALSAAGWSNISGAVSGASSVLSYNKMGNLDGIGDNRVQRTEQPTTPTLQPSRGDYFSNALSTMDNTQVPFNSPYTIDGQTLIDPNYGNTPKITDTKYNAPNFDWYEYYRNLFSQNIQ